jgi:undecaprenyl pyrophosphate synthase
VVEELRRLGHDVLTMYEDSTANQSIPDDEVLALATKKQRALVTTNRRHFIRLHRQSADHGGIIACTFDPDFIGQAQRIAEAIENVSNLTGQLIRVYRPS